MVGSAPVGFVCVSLRLGIWVRLCGASSSMGFAAVVDDESAPRDPFLYPFRTARAINAVSVVAEVLRRLDAYEAANRRRQRRRRPADQAAYERAVQALTCDLMHRHLVAPCESLAVSLSKQRLGRKSRYAGPTDTTILPDLLRLMAAPELRLVELQIGQQGHAFKRGRRTTIQAGSELARLVECAGVTVRDLGEDLNQEVIILKRTRSDFWDAGDREEYDDTEETHRLRHDIREINAWLVAADITCDCHRLDDGADVDPQDRLVRRYFNNARFDHGGRLFGGFWQPMSKAQRHATIRINGEPVTTLDYGQMVVRILYGIAGKTPPTGDAYDVPGYGIRHREGVKKVLSALTFRDKPAKSVPRGSRKLLPRKVSMKEVTEDLRRHHRPIAHFLNTMVGFEVFFRESQIMVDLLGRLRREQIVGLPIHDAVVVPISTGEATRTIMLNAFRDHLHIEGQVSVEHTHLTASDHHTSLDVEGALP
jgi:hypothetical protein